MDIELTGSYPIILSGAETGTLAVVRDGLFWIFDAKCTMQKDLVRLSVFGEDGEGYLGVMEPCGDSLVLTKRLSRATLAGFPQTITHAGVHEENASAPAVIDSPHKDEASIESGIDTPLDENKPPSTQSTLPPVVLSWRPCPCPCSFVSAMTEKAALGDVRGAYFAEDGARTYVAVPVEAAAGMPYGAVPFLWQSNFSGKIFLICAIEDNKIIRRLT